MKSFFCLLLSVSFLSCMDEDNSGVADPNYSSNTLSTQKSPDGKRTLSLIERCNSNSCGTQVVINFGVTGSGVYAVQGKNLGLKTYWKDNNTIVIETKKAYLDDHQKWRQVQSFGNVIKVEYVEK